MATGHSQFNEHELCRLCCCHLDLHDEVVTSGGFIIDWRCPDSPSGQRANVIEQILTNIRAADTVAELLTRENTDEWNNEIKKEGQ
jgi:hypothetical protein